MSIRRAEFESCFTLEALEPRVMLSADGLGVGAAVVDAGARVELITAPEDFGGDMVALADVSDAKIFGDADTPIAMADETAEATWIDAAGGDWSDSANWQDGHVPEAGDDVVITGLDDGATITLTGDTPVLGSLSIDGGAVQINGGLNTDELTVTGGDLRIAGVADSAITGNVNVADGASFELRSGGVLTWSGDTWQQDGFAEIANDDTRFVQTRGALTISETEQFAMSDGASLELTGGELIVPETGAFNIYHDSTLSITDATLTLQGGVFASFNESVVTITDGVLQGTGTYRLNQTLNFAGSTLRPGGADTAGELAFVAGEDGTSGAFNLSGNWSIELDVFGPGDFDTLPIFGAVSFGSDGAMTLDASDADFGSTATGTALGDLITLTGTGVTGDDAAIMVMPGADHTATGSWTAGVLSAETFSPLTPTWVNAAGGDWSDSANWANGRLPAAGDDAVITGLNADAVISLIGDTPVLQSLSIESGTLAITGALNVGTLSIADGATFNLNGAGTSTITGDVSIAGGATMALGGTSLLNWSGTGHWAMRGDLTLASGTELRLTDDGAFTLHAGLLHVEDGAQVRLTDAWGNLVVRGGELRVDGRLDGEGSNVEIEVAAGILSGGGIVTNQREIIIRGTLSPGAGEGDTDWLQLGADVLFADAWSVQLEILDVTTTGTPSFDLVSFAGAVTFSGTGAITLDASEADFGDTATGSTLGDVNGLFYANGGSTGSATVQVIDGSRGTVTGTWNGTDHRLEITVVNDTSGTTVTDGLDAISTAMQGMLGGFNLGTIDFAAQSRTAFTVPTLPGVLADLFDLSALSADVALPDIGNPDGLAATITALEGAGYTVDTTVAGTDFVASLTRTVASDRAVAGGYGGATFAGSTELLAGLADEVTLEATLDLLASLVQHVVFELRDGVFNFLSDSYLALTIVGGATLTGTARQGGRTITATGSTEVDATVRVWNASDGITATGAGTAEIAVSLATDPATLSYGLMHTLSFGAGTLVTSTASEATLSGTLTLDGVTDSDGDPAELALSGTLAEGGDSWTLAGSGSNVQWLSFAVNSWDFSITASEGAFAGSGSIDADLDFLADSVGSAPEVTLNATFDQDEISFNGTLSTDLIAVTNPAGGTYLSIADFSSSVAVTGNLDSGAWTGSLTFSGGDSTFGPEGSAFTASITDGDDEDSVAVEGSYDFSTQAFSTSVDQFELVAENIVRVTAAGVTLRHQRDVTDEQELLAAETVTLELLFLTSAPSTGPPTAEAADLSIRTNGIMIGAGSLSMDEIELGSALSLTGVALSFNGFSFLDGTVSSDSVTLTADAAELFPEGGVFSAAATNLEGTYDFSADDDRIGLSADTLTFGIDGLVEFDATDIVIRPEGDLIFSAETIAATLIPFDLSGEISGLQIASDGTPSAVSFTVDTSGLAESLELGGMLPLEITGIDVAFHGDANANGTRDEGETFRLDAFDLTIAGTFDFGVLDGLPFTPVIQVGGDTFEDGTDEFAVTLRSVAGTFQIWETESITIGVADLQIGNLFEIAGSITLGGYSAGEWVGAFAGNLAITSLNDDVTGNATATVSGSVDVDAGTVVVETAATLDLGIGSTITLSEAALTTDFTLAKDESGDLTFAINTASASVGTLSVGSVFAATNVTASLANLEISGAGVTLGSISFSAASATILPDNDLGITATTTGFSGSYDFTTDPDTFILTADAVSFGLADKVSFEATGVSLTPTGETLFSIATASASLPSLGVNGEVTGFQLAANGTPSATSVLLDTSGLADSLGLGGVLPFNVDTIALNPPGEGERIEFDNFDLTVAGTIDFSGLDSLPFTPTITIDGQTSRSDDETAAEFSFTVRLDDGEIQIWDTPTITLGLEELQIGDLLEIDGSVTLGGYTDGVWGGDFGGSLTVTSLNENVTGSAAATVTGSVDVSTGTITVFTEATLDLGIGTDVVLTAAVASVDFTITDDETDGLVLAIDEANLAVGTLAVGSIIEATDVTATLVDLTVSGAGVTLGSISFSVASATLLPDNELGITAETTGVSGSYDFSTDPDTFELTAESVAFELADVVSFNAAGVSLTPLGAVVLAVDSADATLAGLGSSAAVTGFELAADGTPSATSIELDTEGLTESLELGGLLPLDISAIALAGNGEGERITFTDFDLTVEGTINFSVFADLPFTPYITIGEQTTRSDDETAAEFSFTVRMEDSALQILDSPTITLGLEDLRFGDVLEIDGSITLGGYTDGAWVGAFGGSLTLTALQIPAGADGAAPTSITVDVSGLHDADAGTLQMNIATAISFGLGEDISFVDAGIEVDFTLRNSEEDGLELLDLGVTATAGSMTVGSILTAQDVSVGFSGFSVTADGIALGAVQLSAGAAALFPDSTAFTATVSDFSGSYDFTADSDPFELEAAAVGFEVIDLLSFNATDVVIRPASEVIVSIGSIAVELPGVGVGGSVTGFELTSDGTPSAVALALDTSGLVESLPLAGVLPFELDSIAAAFLGDTNANGVRDEGEVFRLDAFDLSVEGAFNFAALSALPFTPILRIGDTEADDGEDTFSFTVRVVDGTITPWDLGPITIGVSDLNVGTAFGFSGSITLGGYAEGEWVPDFGGSMELAAASSTGNLSGTVSAELTGSIDVETGVLDIDAAFAVSFTLGSYVEVENAGISLSLTIATAGGESGSVTLAEPVFTVHSASVERISVNFNNLVELEATAATFNFEATGEEILLSVGTLSASLTGIGISGSASNFAVAANGGLVPQENFSVSFSFSESTSAAIQWPEWMPIEVSVFELAWPDLAADPLDFTLRLSAAVGIDNLKGTELSLYGSIQNLVIDVGALKAGAFPIIELGTVELSVSGKISSAEVSAGLILGMVRLDADGNQIADDDTTTEVADGLLWGAIRGGINIAGYGGFEIFLGLSEYGPLQGYIKLTAPLTIPYVGIAFTDFRAGITFNSALPSIDDPQELQDHPEFTPTGNLTFGEWSELLKGALETQIETHAEAGNFGVLLSPFTIEGGVTIFSIYASTASFNIQADFKMDSTGKFLARGAFQLGGTISFTANLYIDMSTFITEGDGMVMFLAELPSELPVATIYGLLSFDFGETVDPDNPPAAPFEQFTIRLEGGARMEIAGIPGFVLEGSVAFEVALNAPSLHITVDGRAALPGLGDVVGLAGDFRIFFGKDKTIELAGILALTPADFSQLESIGVTMDAVALLRFNTTSEAIDYTLTIAGQSEPRTFTVAAGEASILVEGVLGLAPAGIELFRLGGLFSMTFSEHGFDVIAAAELTAGPVAAPLLRFNASGYLHLEVNGIVPGMAAQLTLELDADDDVLAAIGVELEGNYQFIMNTTGEDVDFALPTELAAISAVDRIHLPRGPPSADGESIGAAGSYLIVRADGVLNLLDVIDLEGVFDFQISDGEVQLDYEATVRLGVGDITFYQYDAQGVFRIDAAGIYGQADLTIDASAGLPTLALGFSFDATYQLQLNTTNAEQTLGDVTLAAGNYARVRADGALVVGAWRFVGTYDLIAAVDGVSAQAAGSVSLGVGDVEFASFDFAGTLLIRDDGIFAQLALSQSRSAPTVYGFGFSADAGYELSLNTTGEEIDGVAAGLGARIVVTGALEIGNWQIDGVYTLNASTTGIGFAASAALVFKAGDDELFRVPVEFEIELNIPGIIEQIDLALSLEELGINIPGLELSGAAQLLINTTGEPQGDLPPGPILQFAVEGRAIVGGLALDGTFGFESTLGGVTMFGDYAVNLGPEGDPLLSFTGTGEFELTLLGVAGYADLTMAGGVDAFRDYFSADFAFFIEVNTRAVPYTFESRELPAGPSVRIGATGSLEIAGLSLSGSYTLAAGGGGVDLTMDATAAVTLDTLTLISFSAVGGLHLGLDGLVAVVDITPDVVDFDAVGLELNTDANFVLRINTTGTEQTLAGVTLEAGNYARVLFTSSLTFGVFRFEGSFSLSVADATAELLLSTDMVVELPAIGDGDPLELFRMGATGGLRISPDGVVAAFALDRGALDQLTLFDITVPIGLSQEFALHFNTTGSEQTINGIALAAGNYLKIVTSGRMQIGPGWIDGFYSFEAADTGLEIVFDTDYVLGIPGTEVSLLRYHAQGGLSIKANGIAGAVILSAPVGLAGLDSLGLKIDTIGLDQLRMLRVNTTGEEVTLGDVVLEAGHYLEVYTEDTLSVGVARLSGSAIFRADEHGLLLGGDLTLFFGLPGIEGVVEELALVEAGLSIELHLTPGGVYGRGILSEGINPVTIEGVDLTPDYEYQWTFTINTTSEDQTVAGEALRTGSFSLGAVISFGVFGQTIEGNVLFTIDSTNRVIGGLVRGTYDMEIGDWNPFSFKVTGFVFIADAGAGMDFNLELTGGDGIPGVALDADYNLRVSTFTGPTTIEGYTAGDIEVPGLLLDEGNIFRVTANGTMELGGLLLDGSYLFEIADGGGLFDTSLTVAFDATIRLRVGETTLLSFDATGGMSLSVNGIWGGLDIDLATDGLEAALGFDLDATYRLEVNTTGSAQTVGELELPAGPYARVAAAGDLVIGALRLSGTYGFSIGVDGIEIDAAGTVAFGVAGLTFYQFEYEGEFVLDATGLFANLSLSVGSSNRDQYGFGFSADATYTLGVNTTATERDGIAPGLGARVRVAGDLEIGDISMGGVYDLTASTTGIGFAASAALVLRTEDTVLVEVPVDFSYELEIPGIVDEIALELSAEDLGIDIPGLDFEGSAAIVINTTGVAQGDIPAGPILQLAVDGTATVGDLELSGRFGFESSLNRTRMITAFDYHLGGAEDPLLSFSATGAFNLGLDGIAGLFDLEVAGGDESIREMLGNDLTYNLVVNTTGSEYELFDQTLPAGPLYQVEAHGDLDLGGLSSSGDYIFRIDGEGLLLETEADLNLSIPVLSGDDIQLFNFALDGGIAITKAGIAAALDLTPTYASLDAFGFELGPEMAYRLAVNTTGESFTFGDTELEAGIYGRVEARGSMSFGIATMTGLFRVEADTAGVFEMQAVTELQMAIPGLGELFRFSQSGGFRFDSTGVIAAIDLERSLAADRLELGGITLPFTNEQSFLLRVNTTGEAREIAGVELEAGNYFAIDTVGELDLGIARGIGEFTFLAGDGQMDVELTQELTLGIPFTEVEFYSFNMTGGLNVSSDGVYGALGLTRQLGLAGLDSVGISFDNVGAEEGQWMLINTTGEVQTVGERTLEAGNYIEFEHTGVMNIGVLRMEGIARLRAGDEGLIAQVDGVQFLGLPEVGDFEGLTLFEAGISAELNITGEGVWGYAQLTQTREAVSVGGVNLTPNFAAGVYLQLNTTATERTVNENVLAANAVRVAGTMNLDLLGSELSGHAILTVDWAQGYGAISFDGSASIGIGDWRPFSYDATGFILIGEAGMATNLDLTLNDEVGLAGVTFDGTWSLRASTMNEAVTIAGFSASGLDVPEIMVEAGHMLRTHLSGSVTVLGGLTIEGEFDLSASSTEFTMASAGTIEFFGVTTRFDGRMYIHPDRGFVANVELDWAGIENPFMELSGNAYLRINTWAGGVWEGVAANTYEVGIDSATLRLGFSELTGSGKFQWVDGEARLWTDMTFSPIPGLSANISGFISSSGTYDLDFSGGTDGAFGIDGLMTLTGSYAGRLSNSGLTGSWDGRIDWPTDYSRFTGAFSITDERMELTLGLPRTWLLGIGIISGEVTVVAEDGRLSLSAAEDAPLRMEVAGDLFDAQIWGTIATDGTLDFHGTASLDVGDANFVKISGALEVHVSNSGFRANLSGRIDLLGVDYTTVSGSVVAEDGDLAMSLDMGRVKLLGDALILSGRIEAYLQDGRVGFNVAESNPLSLEVLGGVIESTVWGYIWSDGVVNLNGTATLNIGDANFVKLSGALEVHVSNDGFSATLDGRIDLLGIDYTTVRGSVVIDGSDLAMSLDMGRVKLLGDALILSGRIEAYMEDGRVGFNVAESNPLTLEVLGGVIEATVWGYIWSSGQVNLNGSATLNIGDANFVKLSGALEVHVSNDGFSATLDGRIDLLGGDYTTVRGSVAINGSDLAMSLDMGRVKLLGDALIISGRIEAYLEDGRVGFNVAESNPLTLEVLGGVIEASVWGYIWSSGQVNLNGTASLDLGSQSTLRVRGDLAVHVGNDGFTADLSGRIDLFNLDWTSVEGSIAIQGGELAMSLAMERVKLLGNALIVSGQIDLNRAANGRMVLSADRSSPLRVELAGGIAELTGWGTISTDGTVDISASGRLDIGSTSALAVVGDLDIDISRTRIAGSLNSYLWIAGDTTNTTRSNVSLDLQTGRFSFSTDGRVRVLGVTLSTQMTVTVGPDGVGGSLRASATIFGNYYHFSGSFSTSGSWSFAGRSSGWIGVKHIADARYYSYFEFNDRGGSFAIWGTMWIFGNELDFSASVDLNNRTASFSAGSIWGTVYFDSGIVKPWASRLENATVFFDANLNGVLDDGEPVGVRLADGGYDFGATAPDSITDATDLGVLIEYDIDGDNFLSATEFKAILEERGEDIAFAGLGSYAGLDIDEDGAFNANEARALADQFGLVQPDENTLGLLAPYDLNGDNRITDDEVAIYAVNGISDDGGAAPVRYFIDANNDGIPDAGELSADLSASTVADFYNNPNVVPEGMEEFDTNGNGRLDGAELDGLSTVNLGSRVPLTRLSGGVNGTLTVDDADFVFADVNGNGAYDAGEPRVTPTGDGRYFFREQDSADGSADAVERNLGQLAPYDTNGNGRIDSHEGEFIVTGGTDLDSGVDNTLVMRAPAGGFGDADVHTVSPLSTLMASLMERGLDEAAAEALIEEAFDLPAGIELSEYDPVNLLETTDLVAESSSLSAGAKLLAVVTGGASLLGDDGDASLQDAVMDSLAAALIDADANGGGDYFVELADAGLLTTVLADAGSRLGRNIDVSVAAAVAEVLANATDDIDEAAVSGGDVSRALAAHKAVILTTVNNAIEEIAAGNLTIDELLDQLSDDQINTLLEAVDLLPSIGPSLPPLYDIEAEGGEVFALPLTVEDPDSRLSNLHFTAVSSNQQVVADEDLHFEYVQGRWQLSVTTGALSSGSTMITLSVSDGWETYYNEFEIVLDGMNPAVRLETALPDHRLVAGQVVLVDLADHFVDQNNDVTYTVTALGTNAVVDAQIVGGQLQLTARNDLSGLAVFDLVATDADTTIIERFAVITYPTVAVSESVRYTATGEIEIDVTLSNPATQSLSLRYTLASNDPGQEALAGLLRFAAGETAATLVINLAESGFGNASVSELGLDVQGAWTTGDFTVAVHNRNPGQLLDLQRRVGLSLEFTLIYDFVAAAAEEETVLFAAVSPDAEAVHVSTAIEHVAGAGVTTTGEGASDLVARTSLEATERPRALRGI